MLLTKERIHYLLDAYITKQANASEESELMDWVLQSQEDSELKSYMLDVWNRHQPTEDLSYVKWDDIYSHVMGAAVVSLQPKVRKRNWVTLIAAAVIVGAFAIGAYFYLAPSPKKHVTAVQPQKNDIAPPSANKAILTLGDGTRIELDSTGNGILATQGSVKIIKQSSGEISYSGTSEGVISYNTVSVPRGSKPLRIVLSDGSKVWINVGSSLSYPTAFTGSERKVSIAGEAYFDVVHNNKMPFIVQNGDLIIKDLGTSFNVNTYQDESSERITLLEGSVSIEKMALSKLLKPGQQARINYNANPDIKVFSDVDLNEVLAWKDGKFMFDNNTDIGTIMRQISRWYNVEIEYQGDTNQRFWGSISKDVHVSEVLKILETAGGIKFKVKANKIIVMPESS